jgi:hypothetical protein
LYFLLVGPLIKLRSGTPINTLIVVTIELFIVKVIKILNFNCVLVPGTNNKGLKGLIELYIINLTIFKLVDII